MQDSYLLFRFVPTMRCNYRCEYCFVSKEERSAPSTLFDHHTPDEWVEAMGRWSDYEVEFYCWGGEPFVLPATYDVVRGWTQYDHVIDGNRLDTNVSFADRIAGSCPSPKVKLNCSWHTQYDTLDQITAKMKRLREVDMVGMLNFVASDRNMRVLRDDYCLTIDELIARFDDLGVFVNIAGDFNKLAALKGVEYEDYKRMLLQHVNPEDWRQLRNEKGPALCAANQHFFTVYPTGDIRPCLGDTVCGNFFEGTLTRPDCTICSKPCPSVVAYPFRTDNPFPFSRHLVNYVQRNREYRAQIAVGRDNGGCAVGMARQPFPTKAAEHTNGKDDSNVRGFPLATCWNDEGGRAPRISVVLPTYNHAYHLPKAVESVLAQTVTDFELIVVNDGSTDGTEAYLNTVTDPRVRTIHQENRRLPGALNAGFSAARGDLLTWVSADNYCAPMFLEALAGALDANPECGLAVSAFARIDENDAIVDVVRDQDLSPCAMHAGNPGIASFMYRRSGQEAVGLYDTTIEGAEDWDMWIRLSERSATVYVPEVLYYYRMHAATMTARIQDQIVPASRRTILNAFARMGDSVDIGQLYPAIAECEDREGAQFHACFDFGTRLLQSRFGMADLATRFLEAAVTMAPLAMPAVANLAIAYHRTGRNDEALRLCEHLTNLPAAGLDVVTSTARDAHSQHNPQAIDALPVLEFSRSEVELLRRQRASRRVWSLTVDGAQASSAQDSRSLHEEGMRRYSAGDVEGALAQFTDAVAADRDDIEARTSLADLLLESNRPDEALVHYRTALAAPEDCTTAEVTIRFPSASGGAANSFKRSVRLAAECGPLLRSLTEIVVGAEPAYQVDASVDAEDAESPGYPPTTCGNDGGGKAPRSDGLGESGMARRPFPAPALGPGRGKTPGKQGISFCIVTGGKRPEMLDLVMRSVRAQRIAQSEIIVTGRHHDAPGIAYIEACEHADAGRLGAMRNLAVAQSKHDLICLLDDDILLTSEWYDALLRYDGDFDILTSQVRLPDGTRYWDHATYGGPRGHVLLAADEEDDNAYMTGGGGWVMRRAVAESVRWDDNRGFYQNEDIEFSSACRQAGFRIRHNPDAIVYHADATYTSFGRQVKRRSDGRTHEWAAQELMSVTPMDTLREAERRSRLGEAAETADCIRLAALGYPHVPAVLQAYDDLLRESGGSVSDDAWFPNGDPEYRRLVESLAGVQVGQRHTAITWQAGVFNYSGYARLSRDVLPKLEEAGAQVALRAAPPQESYAKQLVQRPAELRAWQNLLDQPGTDGVSICLDVPVLWDGTDLFGYLRRRRPGFDAYVGCTMFETDRLPAGWADACNDMNEIWVPSTFNAETFARAGVDAERIRVVRFGIDATRYGSDTVEPMTLPHKSCFQFLSVFQWNKRKGWDVLLEAYLEAFTREDDVCLTIRSYPDGVRIPPIRERVEQFVRSHGASMKRAPRIHVIEDFVPDERMPALYSAADAFVLPTRGEGWGIPYMEAAATGLPVIATRWSAHLDFLNDDNSYLIDVPQLVPVDDDQHRDNPFYTPDQLYAQPSIRHTADLMRRVYENREEAEARGTRARADMQTLWRLEDTAAWIVKRVAELSEAFPARRSGRSAATSDGRRNCPVVVEPNAQTETPNVDALRLDTAQTGAADGDAGVVWHGPIRDPSGYAEEVRAFLLALEHAGRRPVARELAWNDRTAGLPRTVISALDAMAKRQTPNRYVHVSHAFPTLFERDAGAIANVGRTMFETDRLPDGWASACNLMDRVWVPSEFNRETFARAGVSESRLRVLPGTFDFSAYDPNVEPLRIDGAREFNFLSVFDWTLRKGWDVLIRAFVEEFAADEDVALILKTHSSLGYTADRIAMAITELVEERLGRSMEQTPEIVLDDSSLASTDMPRLYRAAQSFVLPTRGEGWGRPFMEAMAMELPTIGTNWSGNTAFMTRENSFLLDCELVPVPAAAIAEAATFGGHRWAEPDVEHLRSLMRGVVKRRDEAREVGVRARADLMARFSYEVVARQIVELVDEVAEGAVAKAA